MRQALSALFLVLVTAVVAAEPDATPAPQGAARQAGAGADSFAGSRKDFGTIRAPSANLDVTVPLPSIQVPALGNEPAAGAPVRPPESALRPAPGTPGSAERARKPGSDVRPGSNWLVDAMQPNASESKDKAQAADESVDLTKDRDLTAHPGDRADLEGVAEKNGKDRTTHEGPGATGPNHPAMINPLDPFMDSWVDPRDRALLLGGSSKDGSPSAAEALSGLLNSAGSSRSAEPAMASLQSEWADAVGALGGSRSATLAPGSSAADSGTNPYLASVLADLSAPAGRSEPAAFGLEAGAASKPAWGSPVESGGLAPTPAATQQPIPDFARPPDDDKYFKQLKRF